MVLRVVLHEPGSLSHRPRKVLADRYYEFIYIFETSEREMNIAGDERTVGVER